MLFQLFLIIFAAFAILRTSKQYRDRRVSKHWFVLWSVLWVFVILVAVSPQTTDIIAASLGVERGADLLVYTAVVILMYAMYRVFVRLEKQNKELTDLVRKMAIKNAKKKDD